MSFWYLRHRMHPFYHRYHFGFGRRLFWFGLGALGATWWHRHHQGGLCSRREEFIKQREDRQREFSRSDAPPYPFPYPSPSVPHPQTSTSQVTTPPQHDVSYGFDQQRVRELGSQATDAVS